MSRFHFLALAAAGVALGAAFADETIPAAPAEQAAPAAAAANEAAASQPNPLIEKLNATIDEIKASGESQERLETLGDLYLQLGDVPRAILSYQKAIDDYGGTEMICLKLARSLLVGGRPELGLEALKVALKAYPESTTLLGELGQAYNAFGKHYAAAAILKQAIGLDPSDFRLKYHLGIALRAQKKWEEAKTVVDEALVLQSDDLLLQLLKGDLMINSDDERAAVRYIEDIYEKNPDSKDVKRLLSLAYQVYATKEANSGRITRAIKTFQSAAELGIDVPVVQAKIATLHYEAGDFLEAEKVIRGTIEAYPDFLEAYGICSTVLKALERADEGRAMVEEGLRRARSAKDQGMIASFEQMLGKRPAGKQP